MSERHHPLVYSSTARDITFNELLWGDICRREEIREPLEEEDAALWQAEKHIEGEGSNNEVGKWGEARKGKERLPRRKGCMGEMIQWKKGLVSKREHCMRVGYYYERKKVIVKRSYY